MTIHQTQRGLSLIELMVAMTLGLLLIAGVGRMFVSSKHGYRVQESTGRMQESVRFAMELIAREIRQADFWGGVASDAIQTYPSGLLSGTTTVCPSTPGAWQVDYRSAVRGYEGGDSAPLTGNCTNSGYVSGSDVLALRYADPNRLPTTANVTGGDYFVLAQVGRNAAIFAGTDKTAASALVSGTNATGTYYHRFRTTVFSVGTYTPSGGSGVPTLYLYTIGGSAAQPAVEGVEQMQLAYGIDRNADSAVDRYEPASALAASDWRSVIAVRVGLIVRGDALDNFSDSTTYQLPGGATYTPAAAVQRYQRKLVIKDIQVRNRVRG